MISSIAKQGKPGVLNSDASRQHIDQLEVRTGFGSQKMNAGVNRTAELLISAVSGFAASPLLLKELLGAKDNIILNFRRKLYEVSTKASHPDNEILVFLGICLGIEFSNPIT